MIHSSRVRNQGERGKHAVSVPGGLGEGVGWIKDQNTSGMSPLAQQIAGKSQGQPCEPPGTVSKRVKNLMIKPLFAEFFAGLIPSVHIDSWGEPAPALLSQPWRSAGVPPPSQRGRRQWEKMLLGKITNKTAQRTCGGEALVLCFNPRQVWGLQTPRRHHLAGMGRF